MSEWICMGCFKYNSEENCYCDKCYKIRCNQFCWYCNKCDIENSLIECECGNKYTGLTQSTTNETPNIRMPNIQISVRTSLINANENNTENDNLENIESILNDRISSLLSSFTNNETQQEMSINLNTGDINDNNIINTDNILNTSETNSNENNINSDDTVDLNNLSDSENIENKWKCNICNNYNEQEEAICNFCKSLADTTNDTYEWLCTRCGTLETNSVCESCNAISYREFRSRISSSRINRIVQFINTALSEELFKDIEFKITAEELDNISQDKYSDKYKENDSCCPICMETFNNDDSIYIMDKCCNKIIHKDCLDIWFQKSYKCPLCRNEFKHEIIK